MNAEDIEIYCASANHIKWALEIKRKNGIEDLVSDNSLASYIISILIHLDKLKLSINNINSRLMALEEKVKNEWVNH